jgi:hypothetical protein
MEGILLSNFRMASPTDGAKTFIPMEDIMKGHFWEEFLMALADSSWKTAISMKEKSSLVEPTETDTSKPKMGNTEAFSKTISGTDTANKPPTT